MSEVPRTICYTERSIVVMGLFCFWEYCWSLYGIIALCRIGREMRLIDCACYMYVE